MDFCHLYDHTIALKLQYALITCAGYANETLACISPAFTPVMKIGIPGEGIHRSHPMARPIFERQSSSQPPQSATLRNANKNAWESDSEYPVPCCIGSWRLRVSRTNHLHWR